MTCRSRRCVGSGIPCAGWVLAVNLPRASPRASSELTDYPCLLPTHCPLPQANLQQMGNTRAWMDQQRQTRMEQTSLASEQRLQMLRDSGEGWRKNMVHHNPLDGSYGPSPASQAIKQKVRRVLSAETSPSSCSRAVCHVICMPCMLTPPWSCPPPLPSPTTTGGGLGSSGHGSCRGSAQPP